MSTSIIHEIQNAPLPQMLSSLGLAIADTQYALDENSIKIAKLMGQREMGEDALPSLLELGFSPSFYQIAEANLDIKVSMSMSQSKERGLEVGAAAMGGVGFVMVAASVNVSMTNKYSYDASASSALQARLVAVPPPTIFHNYMATKLNPKAVEASEETE